MSEGVELKIIGGIGSVRLQEGDSILITSPSVLSAEQACRIKEAVSRIYEGFPVIIMDSGLKMEVMRPVEK